MNNTHKPRIFVTIALTSIVEFQVSPARFLLNNTDLRSEYNIYRAHIFNYYASFTRFLLEKKIQRDVNPVRKQFQTIMR